MPIHFNSSYFDTIMTLTRPQVEDYYWSVVVPLGIPKASNSDYFDRETRKGYRLKDGEDLGHFLTPQATATTSSGFGSAGPGGGTAGLSNQLPGGN